MSYKASDVQLLEGSYVDAQIFAVLLAAGLCVLAGRRQQAAAFLGSNIPLLVFFLYCALSISWSDYPFVSFKRWVKAVGDLVMVLIVLTDPEPSGAIKKLLTRTSFLLIPTSILLIRYYPSLGRGFGTWSGSAYNMGVSTGKNGLGILCLISGLGSLWYLLKELRDRTRTRSFGPLIAFGSLLALTLWLFKLADSATSFGCFLIGSIVIAVTSLRAVGRKPAFLHLIVPSMLLVIIYGVIVNSGMGITNAVGRDSTLTGRTQLWVQLLDMSVSPWFGEGYESFWIGDRLQVLQESGDENVHQAHNGYLQVYLDLGLVGVGVLAFVMAWGYGNIIRAIYADMEVGRLKLALFVVAVVYNLTEHGFRELHPVWLIFILAIMAIPESSWPVSRIGHSPTMAHSMRQDTATAPTLARR